MSYRAQVRIRRDGVDHNESATFTKLTLAKAWIKQREGTLEKPGALDTITATQDTIGDLIRSYIDNYRDVLRWGRNKQKTLEQMQRHALAQEPAGTLTAARLVAYARDRRAEGAGPATVSGALTWLAVVFQASDGFDAKAIKVAQSDCRQMGLIGSAQRRKRRPTARELERLYRHFDNSRMTAVIPMSDIVAFAIASARRRNEIIRLRWDDNDPETMTGLVRDAKHPRHKWGNHKRFKYTREAWAIMQRQSRASEFIFPYQDFSITARFVRACKRCDIPDLRFHDLRHEATSRLFEAGGTITEVQQYTLHESWDMLRRYTQLRPEDVRQF